MKGKTLGAIVLGLAIGLGSSNCDKSNETSEQNTIQVQQQYQTKSIEGEISHIDEDSFPIGGAVDMGGWATEFLYEHIRIKDSDGEERKFVIPHSSGYKVGDKVKFSYIPIADREISYGELFRKYTQGISYRRSNVIQRGKIEAEGIIIR